MSSRKAFVRKFMEYRDLNPGWLFAKRECFPCAMQVLHCSFMNSNHTGPFPFQSNDVLQLLGDEPAEIEKLLTSP